MKTFFSRRMLLLLPMACVAIYGCEHEETVVGPELSDVLYEGDTTDEALVSLDSALDQKPPVTDATRAPTLDMPTLAQLPKTPVPTFTWHTGMVTERSPGKTEALRQGLALIQWPEAKSSFQTGFSEFFGPVKSAHAHGDPLVGPATFLVFSTASDAKLVRVFTTFTSYTPSQTVWDKMIAAKAEITLSLIGAEFDNNRIADSGGPFQGSKFVFTITP